jgi:futalosine hydrolase
MAPPDLLLLCATEGEGARVAAQLTERAETVQAGRTVRRGRLERVGCRLVVGGLGLVNTAAALAAQLAAAPPRLVLQFGIAGAYVPAGLAVGAVACATEEIYGDLGVLTPAGWQPADLIGIPLLPGAPPRFNRFPLDAALVEHAARAAGARAGPFVTVSTCTGVRTVGDALHHRWGALCESMEGAAAAHVCALYRVPFLEVRGVSNLVEDRDREKWQLARAVAAAQDAALQVVDSLGKLYWG